MSIREKIARDLELEAPNYVLRWRSDDPAKVRIFSTLRPRLPNNLGEQSTRLEGEIPVADIEALCRDLLELKGQIEKK